MSDLENLQTTLPSGTTGARQSHSSRIGGPGRLLDWPLSTEYPVGSLDRTMAEAVVDLAIGLLTRENVRICGLTTWGRTLPESDDTLLIKVSFEERHGQLVSILNDLIQAASGMGFHGRVEMLDPKATQGPKSFPPSLTSQQKNNWESTLQRVISSLSRLNVDWQRNKSIRQIVVIWEEISRTTVVVKAEILPQKRTVLGELARELADSHFGLERQRCAGESRLAIFGYSFMDISVTRRVASMSSTLGGYLRISTNGTEHVVGLTCFHGVRVDEQGRTDQDVDANGAKPLSWPCQSPSHNDVRMFAAPLEEAMSQPIPATSRPRSKDILVLGV
ncbi:hypothetical protein BDW59DRAFT_167388 [Aspergillus cavernicola]|uniref:Uncharacterized protein n=1 Tax=Aspergillus cavernicola TaxID=176166 RepID=A0ABR4HE69_9EURO